jgi:cell division protein FtsW
VQYQVKQANIAIAKGWPLGVGPGNSVQRNYLPEPFSDFIYAIILEEYGILGGVVIMIIYIIFLYRCISIVIKSPKAFGAFLAVGLGLSLSLQAMINMGVAVNLLPVTGVTLPFISMGGSSIWFNSMALGIILSVSRYIEEMKSEEVDDAFIPNVVETT